MKILVDPRKLEQGAKHIVREQEQYEQSYRALLQACRALQTNWKGKDHQAFMTQIEGFEDDFKKLSQVIEEYVKFLRTSASIYEKVQNERLAQARRLCS